MIKPSCVELAAELEQLCPGVRFLSVTDAQVRYIMPTRHQIASELLGFNVPSGEKVEVVDLVKLGDTPEEWFRYEISSRRGGVNPDFVERGEDGQIRR